MIKSAADLAVVNEDGSLTYPMGPCSAWPKERNDSIRFNRATGNFVDEQGKDVEPSSEQVKIKATVMDMAKNLTVTTVKALSRGKLNKEDRDKRYNECLNCPSFVQHSKRCSECGCFMSAKTWVAGATCPLGKW
jgi:hypothetical protein